jgi:hypothetical protein
MGEWILGNLDSYPITGEAKNKLLEKMALPWMGHVVIGYPAIERHTALDYTGPLGSVMGIYYSLVFQLSKWEYKLQKAGEWVEISPVHAQYYQLTHRQKEELEGKIKQGLVSVSQSVADMELLMHDRRRYEEFLHYMGYRTYGEAAKQNKDAKEELDWNSNLDKSELYLKEDEKNARKMSDQHSLKAVFVDQVDVHTGEGISMRSIVSRWPTLITDFMNMSDEDMEIDKVMKKLNVSRAEAVVLITKNKLYQEWKALFGPEIKNRYERINELLISRRTSVEKYREWLKPYIARHKLLEEGLSSAGGRGEKLITPFETGGMATSSSEITLYVWKDFLVPEIFKGGSEETGKLLMEIEVKEGKEKYKTNSIPVDDDWTKRNLIFHKEWGLITQYKWITERWVREQKEAMFRDRWLTPHKPYYTFFPIKLMRSTIRMPSGEEIDDGVFDVTFLIMSQNAMFCKLLELKARQEEMEQYVDNLLGIRNKNFPGVERFAGGRRPPYAEGKKGFAGEFLEKMSLAFQFAKGGPYERDFNDRMTKGYLQRAAGERYGQIVGFLKKKMGVGG